MVKSRSIALTDILILYNYLEVINLKTQPCIKSILCSFATVKYSCWTFTVNQHPSFNSPVDPRGGALPYIDIPHVPVKRPTFFARLYTQWPIYFMNCHQWPPFLQPTLNDPPFWNKLEIACAILTYFSTTKDHQTRFFVNKCPLHLNSWYHYEILRSTKEIQVGWWKYNCNI